MSSMYQLVVGPQSVRGGLTVYSWRAKVRSRMIHSPYVVTPQSFKVGP